MLRNEDELKELRAELVDRYGTPTDPVEALLQVAHARLLAREAGLVHVLEKQDWLELKWQRVQDMPPLVKLEPKLRSRFRTVPDSNVTFRVSLKYIPDILSFLNYIFKAFIKLRKGNSLD